MPIPGLFGAGEAPRNGRDRVGVWGLGFGVWGKQA